MKSPFPVLLDRSANHHKTIFVSAGKLGEFLELSPEGLLQVTGGHLADLSGPFSDERYGRNFVLLPGSRVKDYEVRQVLSRDCLGILYEASSTKGEPVLLSEFFPDWRCGLSARRASDGEEVCYLSYVHDQSRAFEERGISRERGLDAVSELAERYQTRIEKPGCTLPVLDGFCANQTFYTVMAWEEGEILTSRIRDGRKMGYEELKSSFDLLSCWLESLSEEDLRRLSLRPASFFLRKRDGRALLLPLTPPGDLLGVGGSMQFHYQDDIEPYVDRIRKESAQKLRPFTRVLFYALTGKPPYGCSLEKEIQEEEGLLMEAGVPREEVRKLFRLKNM